jgi:hypothetical protein
MSEFGFYFIIYGYVWPTFIMTAWIACRVYKELWSGEKFISPFIRSVWPMFIPGVSLLGVCIIVLLVTEDVLYWLSNLTRRILRNMRRDDYERD